MHPIISYYLGTARAAEMRSQAQRDGLARAARHARTQRGLREIRRGGGAREWFRRYRRGTTMAAAVPLPARRDSLQRTRGGGSRECPAAADRPETLLGAGGHEADQVAFRVLEPCRLAAARHLGNAVLGSRFWRVVLLELHAATPHLLDGSAHVGHMA